MIATAPTYVEQGAAASRQSPIHTVLV